MPKRYNPQDSFFRKAKKEGFRARSAYKLENILERFPSFVPKNSSVLDLGCCPGSFLQALKKKEPRLLVGVDLQKTDSITGAEILQGDIFSDEIAQKLFLYGRFQVITSDMAPKTTGIPDTDQFHSVELCERVLELCPLLLQKNGNLLLKIFVGADFDPFWAIFKKRFQKAKVYKPESSRDRSRETFLVGQGYIPPHHE
jgi:23S rRNA (uridine2552-2'-O)-methyltransferase